MLLFIVSIIAIFPLIVNGQRVISCRANCNFFSLQDTLAQCFDIFYSSYSTNQNVVLKWLGLHNCAKFTNLCWWKDLFLRIEESSRFRPLKFNKSKNCYVIVWNSLYIKLMYTLIYLSWKKKDFVFTNSYIKVQKVLIWKYLKVITFNLFISFCCMSPSHPFLPSHLVARVLDAKLREPVFKSIWWLLCWISLSFFRGQWNECQEFLEDDG